MTEHTDRFSSLTKRHAMVLAAFAADSLALAPHWFYDTDALQREFGMVSGMLAPRPGSYHAQKKKGDFTHYGDQAYVLLQSLARNEGFELDDFAQRWKELFSKGYIGYVDSATKKTLAHFASGSRPADSGSDSTDVSSAGRVAPVLFFYANDEEAARSACAAQTRMTHNSPVSLEATDFFAQVTLRVLHGMTPSAAIERTLQAEWSFPFLEWHSAAVRSLKHETVHSIKHLGQSCSVETSFASVLYLILKYEQDLRTALVQNVMAGGDSAARGMIIGTVLGAYLGIDAVPKEWLKDMNYADALVQLMGNEGLQ